MEVIWEPILLTFSVQLSFLATDLLLGDLISLKFIQLSIDSTDKSAALN